MKYVAEQADREHRIHDDIVVDAYGDTERAMSWYYYLEDALQVPFNARCQSARSSSPLKVGQEICVVGMADEVDCMSEVFVKVKHGQSTLAVPLAQLASLANDEGTRQAVEDWHYWVGRGYQF